MVFTWRWSMLSTIRSLFGERPWRSSGDAEGNAAIEGIEQIAAGHAPGLSNAGISARQQNRTQPGIAVEAGVAGGKKFAAPDGSIGAEAGAIPGHADDASFELVLGHATGDVGVMMLNADGPEIRLLERELGAEIAGVQIVGDGRGRDVEEATHALQRLLKKLQSLVIFQVAEVLAGQSEAGARETERVLQLGAAGQDLRLAAAQPDGPRSVAAGAPQQHGVAGDHADDRIVDPGVNAAIVMGEDVGDAGKVLLGFGILDDNGLFADVAAGHDQRGVGLPALAKDPKEKIVHGRAGQHDARWWDCREKRRRPDRRRGVGAGARWAVPG